MASRGYSLTGNNLTFVNAVVTATWLNPIAAPNVDFKFRRFWIGQSLNVTSVNYRIQINTQPTGFPTVVAATPGRLAIADPISVISGNTTGAAGTCGVNASAEGSGTKVIIWPDVFNTINGWLLVLTPAPEGEQIEMGAGAASGLGMHLPQAMVPLTNWSFGCVWIEN